MCNKWAMTYKFPCVISPDDAMYGPIEEGP